MKHSFVLIIVVLALHCNARAAMKTDTLSFLFEGRTYSGLLDRPADSKPAGLVVIIPGSGKTDIEHWNWMRTIREHLTQAGFASFIYDKMGCGKSEGVYNDNQTIQNSAQEAIAAIEELKRRNTPGSEKIGLWGLSRGGWVCPLIIVNYASIKFWISVSGPDGLENSAYLLERNFLIEGRRISETNMLLQEWYANYETVVNGKTFEENQKATEHLRSDSFYVFLGNGNKPTPEGYLRWQKSFETGENFPFDGKTCSLVYFPGFDSVLNRVNCPVLAIFGEKDSQVNWRKTKSLYERTIGKNTGATLSVKTFPEGNHIIQKCRTGGLREKLETFEYCDGYFEVMSSWLKSNVGG